MNTHAIKCTAYDKRYIKGQADDFNKLSDYAKLLI